MVLRSFWRQNQLHGTHSFQENTILVNQFGWYKIIMANFQCVLSHYCTSFHETIYKGTNTCGQRYRPGRQSVRLCPPAKPPRCLLWSRAGPPGTRSRQWAQYSSYIEWNFQVLQKCRIGIQCNIVAFSKSPSLLSRSTDEKKYLNYIVKS